MHNRWWSDSATCGERMPHYHSASKMSNNVVPLRGTLLLVPPLRRLRPCGLASGQAPSALVYFPFLRHLREEEEYLAEIAEPAEEIINLNNQINLCETQTHHLRENAHTEQTH